MRISERSVANLQHAMARNQLIATVESMVDDPNAIEVYGAAAIAKLREAVIALRAARKAIGL